MTHDQVHRQPLLGKSSSANGRPDQDGELPSQDAELSARIYFCSLWQPHRNRKGLNPQGPQSKIRLEKAQQLFKNSLYNITDVQESTQNKEVQLADLSQSNT